MKLDQKLVAGVVIGIFIGGVVGAISGSLVHGHAVQMGGISIRKRAKTTDRLVGLWRSSVKGDNHLVYLLPNQECAILGQGAPTACFWTADREFLSIWIPVEGAGEDRFRYNLGVGGDQRGGPPNRLTFEGDIEPAYLRKEMHRYGGGIATDWRE